jgi:hypothetical protein
MAWALGVCLAFFFGWFLGQVSEAWEWRLSADRGAHSRKSGGGWYTVLPADYEPPAFCPVCWRRQAVAAVPHDEEGAG